MPLYRLKEFYPDPQAILQERQYALDLTSYSLYSESGQKIGSIQDVLLDDNGHFRYLVIGIAAWGLSKKALLPIGLARFDYDVKRIYVDGLTKDLVERLMDYDAGMVVNESYEERVRDIYRALASRRADRRFFDQAYTTPEGHYRGAPSGYTPSQTYRYNREPIFYGMSDYENHQRLKQYEKDLAESQHQRVTSS